MREKVQHTVFPAFRIEPTDGEFMGAHVYSYGKRHLLIEKCGHIILLDDSVYQLLEKQIISDDMYIKLVQRNFIKSDMQNYCNGTEHKKIIMPDFFMIDFTKKCNMACKYCFREGMSSSVLSITSQRLQDICSFIIKHCKENACSQITVQPWGGEPLLEKDKIFHMQEIFINAGIEANISIETNGLMLTDKLIAELVDRNITVGISLDGIKQVHDSQRVLHNQAGTYEQVIEGLNRLRGVMKNDFGVIMTITRYTIPHIEEILDFFAKNLNINYIKINFVHKSDFVDNEELCLLPNEIYSCASRIFYKIMDLNEEGYDFFESNIQIRLLNLLGLRNSSICCSFGCNGGYRMIAFDSKGNVYPCELTDYPQEQIGSIDQEISLIQMVRKAKQNMDYFLPKREAKCYNCPWWCYCQGGCTVQAKCMGKAIGEVDDIECICNNVWYEGLIKMILEKPNVINHFLHSKIVH